MAWTSLTFAFGSTLTSTKMTQMQDNFTAVANGDSGAPNIQTNAIANSAVTESKIATGAVTNSKLQPPAGGTGYLIFTLQDTQQGTNDGLDAYPDPGRQDRYNAATHLGVTCLVAGTIRAYLEQLESAGHTNNCVRILKNGALVQEWCNPGGAAVARSVDISVSVGDRIVFQNKSGASGFTSLWQNLRIYSNNPNFAVA